MSNRAEIRGSDEHAAAILLASVPKYYREIVLPDGQPCRDPGK
ncbi:Uncharacterised protein [Mycobacteroides abscessus subsp. massiliense]|nr:Uncharacterised protein [Mycobacteroides abscessus subsp. massiliense]SLD42728.1 Uncharacterised protein [Mycobacteroides abscessus subsp. massiliense]